MLHAASTAAHDALATDALGLPWRPVPPLVEISTVTLGNDVVALLLDLPEPLPWERIGWTLTPSADGSGAALADATLAWSGDGTRAIVVRSGGAAFARGPWTLGLALRLDVGAERAAWRRCGSTAPETGLLRFALE